VGHRRAVLDDIDLFLQVVSCGSVNKAARVLAVPRSTVSRRLAALDAARVFTRR